MQLKEILKQCTVEGNNIKLPSIQLDRKQYLEVKNALELIGGKWKGGKVQAFVFDEDPSEYLFQLQNGEKRNLKKEFQFFATPDSLADHLVELADIELGQNILEPSAGQGAIINAAQRAIYTINIHYCELMPLNRQFLEKNLDTEFIGEDFLELDDKYDNYFHRIIANPPFAKNQDIEHVYKMYDCLLDKGRLVSIMSNHWRHASTKVVTDFRDFIDRIDAEVHEIDAGAFKESGTNISACIVVIDKDSSIQRPTFKRNGSAKSLSNNGENTTVRQTPKSEPQKDQEELQEPEEILMDLIQTENEVRNGLKNLASELGESLSIGAPKPHEAQKALEASFTAFTYRFNASEVFIDFVDYALLVMKWWEENRDFTYWEKKYTGLYPKFKEMLDHLGAASEHFHDAMGDLFMEMVSHGRNGQFFSPDNVCDMMSAISIPDASDGKTVLDCACGSGRMLLAAGKRNRNMYLFGNDTDATCCKMAVLNLLLNSLQGEIAQMNAITMNYTKSWEVSYGNFHGMNLPVYRVIDNKDNSTFWKLHMNSFSQAPKVEHKEKETPKAEPVQTVQHPAPEPIKSATQLQLF